MKAGIVNGERLSSLYVKKCVRADVILLRAVKADKQFV